MRKAKGPERRDPRKRTGRFWETYAEMTETERGKRRTKCPNMWMQWPRSGDMVLAGRRFRDGVCRNSWSGGTAARPRSSRPLKVVTPMWPLLNSPFFTADICIILVTARHKELIRRRRVWQIAFEDQEKIYSKFAEGTLLRSAKALPLATRTPNKEMLRSPGK